LRKLTHDEISVSRAKIETVNQIKRMPVVVVLDSIRSSYNVGSIFRTSDGAMIEKLILCGYTPTPENKEVLKTALGSTDSINWEYYKDIKEAIINYRNKGYKICALELTENNINYYDIKESDYPLCLVIGNEINGIQQDVLDICDIAIEIPQYGIKQSLNVAIAYGISVYELRKIFDRYAEK